MVFTHCCWDFVVREEFVRGPCARMFIKKPLHLCRSCSSQCVKQDFGLAAFGVNWEALVDTCRRGAIAGGCNSGVQVKVQGCCFCLLLLAVAGNTHPHLWHRCAGGSAEQFQGSSWWHSCGQGCARWGATIAALPGDWVSSLDKGIRRQT